MKPELFREGSSDANVFHDVVEKGEYRLPDSFEPEDNILDIGSHIGSFAYACLQRGAKHVFCFEPDPDNYTLLRKHLDEYIKDGIVQAFPVAVLGGSVACFKKFSGVVRYNGELNYGGGFILGENDNDFGLGQYIVNTPMLVPCIGLDRVNAKLHDVRLMKIDAENSEHDIIANSNLTMVQEIVGEYHPYDGNTVDTLKSNLVSKGFTTEIVPHPNSDLGLFFAARK